MGAGGPVRGRAVKWEQPPCPSTLQAPLAGTTHLQVTQIFELCLVLWVGSTCIGRGCVACRASERKPLNKRLGPQLLSF